MPLVTRSAASLPAIISLLALLNEVGDQTVRFGTASHSAELVPAGAQPSLPTDAANQTTTDFNELFEEKILVEVNPWVFTVRTQKSPYSRGRGIVALSELRAGLPLSQAAHGAGTVSCFLNQGVV